MKKFFFLFFFVFLSFSIPAMAFSDNFNDGDISDWILTGSWSASSYYLYNYASSACTSVGGYLCTSVNTYTATFYRSSTSDAYWSFDILSNSTSSDGGGDTSRYAYTNIYFRNGTGGDYASYNSVTSLFTVAGTSYTPQIISNFHVTIFFSGNNYNISLFYLSNNTLFNTQAVAATGISGGDLIIEHKAGGHAWGFGCFFSVVDYLRVDNIVISDIPSIDSTSIVWGYSEYTIGSNPVFTWSISDYNWNEFACGFGLWKCNWFAEVLKNDEGYNIISGAAGTIGTYIDIGSQTGSYSFKIWSPDDTGTYKVNLRRGTVFLTSGIVTDAIMTLRPVSTSYLLVPATAPAKTNVTVSYNIGVGGINTGIELNYLNNGVEERERGYYINTSGSGSMNITFNRIGTYNVYLKRLTASITFPDLPLNFDMKTVNTYFVPPNPEHNFLTSSIDLTNSSYYMNGVLYGNYSIDAVNYSKGVEYISIYNTDIGVETAQFYDGIGGGIGAQDYGLFAYYISNSVSLVPNAPSATWMAGNNTVRLMLKKDTDSSSIVLATKTFFLNGLTLAGYGLSIFPRSVKVNENVYASVTVPTAAYLEVTGPGYNGVVGSGYFKKYNLSVGQTTITASYKKSGIYGYTLFDPSGNIQISDQITVGDVVGPGPVPTPGPTGVPADTVDDIIGSGWFWAGIIIMMLGVVGGVAAQAPGFFGGAMVGVIVCGVGKLIPEWAVFLIAIVLISVAAFIFGGKTTTGN